MYASEILSLGWFYMEYKDVICEGDGERVLRYWHYSLPLFTVSGRGNYSLEALYMLHQYQFTLFPRLAQTVNLVTLYQHTWSAWTKRSL